MDFYQCLHCYNTLFCANNNHLYHVINIIPFQTFKLLLYSRTNWIELILHLKNNLVGIVTSNDRINSYCFDELIRKRISVHNKFHREKKNILKLLNNCVLSAFLSRNIMRRNYSALYIADFQDE